jgi:hypothetical protein
MVNTWEMSSFLDRYIVTLNYTNSTFISVTNALLYELLQISEYDFEEKIFYSTYVQLYFTSAYDTHKESAQQN